MKRRGIRGIKRFFKVHRIIASAVLLGAVLLAGGGAYAAFGGAPKQAASGDVELSKGLVSWWKFDGNTADSSPYRNTATAVNSPTLTTDINGASNKAYSFAPASFQHMLAGQPSVTSSFTYSGWFRVNSFYTVWSSAFGDFRHSGTGGANGLNFIPRSGTIAMCWGDNTGGYVLGTNCDISFSSAAVTTGAWIHGAVTYDGTTVTAYINGASIGSIAKTITHSTTQATIGRWSSTYNDYYFDGKIDDVRMYNRKLSAAEIAALYSTNNPTTNAASGENGLIGWWKFDGDAKDATPNRNTGTVSAATLTTDREARANSAYSFSSGSSTLVSYGSTPVLDTSFSKFSWGAWVKPSTVTVDQMFLSKQGANYFRIINSSKAFVSLNIGGLQKTVSGNATLAVGTWYRLEAVYDGSALTLYVNGVQDAQLTGLSGTVNFNSGILEIGRWIAADPRWYSGTIDDLRIYNRAITPTEVSKIYSSYNSVVKVSDLQKGLVGYWPLNGSVVDASAYRNSATASSISATTDKEGRSTSAYSFNGSTSQISAVNNPSPTTTGTLSAWVYVNSWGSQYDSIIFKGPGVAWANIDFCIVRDSTTSTFVGSISNGTNTLAGSGPHSSTISTGQWYHLAFTWNGTNAVFYTNGAQTASVSWAFSAANRSTSMMFGKAVDGTSYPLNGKIDDVRIYNRSLTSAEIAALYGIYK